ncbi:biotin--[acetyl-CoA-carboxylase] ligase [Kouleothrix sp.]|uniref:biotin--[acetyl-CoA-carboxylase] ligase n=1 Tax=Kouleothrix sp. TaxID=2779161 RepID=UPI00391AC295
MSDLSAEAIQRALPAQVVGRAVEYYPQLGSTNDLLRQRARAGQPEGLLIVADEQVAGRGRLGRGWVAPPGSSLLLSLLLRPGWLAPADAFAITMLAGVALCEAIEQAVPLRAALKWPNDLLLPVGGAQHKAAGVLSEIELRDGAIDWVVLGMGVNVNWAPRGVVDGRDLGVLATSVGAALGRPADRLALLRALLSRLDARYLALRQGQRAALFADWRARLATLGQPVQVRLPRGELSGVAEDVEPTGALRVRDAAGALHVVLAGDVGG